MSQTSIRNTALVSREYGIFARWPEDGVAWIHPDDVSTMTSLVPSQRIFLREWRGGEYATLRYGASTVRIKPTMWETVAPPEYQVGAEVEICSALMQNEPGPATVLEVEWDRYLKCARYTLQQHGMRLQRTFTASDVRPMKDEG